MILGTSSLFERKLGTNKYEANYNVDVGNITNWSAMELLRGAPIRVTVRSRLAVRIEAISRPNEIQKSSGISTPWFRDIVGGADHWLREAVSNTDLSEVPDGEWAGTAIGEQIMGNPLNLEGHTVVFDSLFPWNQNGLFPAPPALGRTPIDFEGLRFLLMTQQSLYSPGSPIDGILWWDNNIPVAYVRLAEFPTTYRTPSEDVLISDIIGEYE